MNLKIKVNGEDTSFTESTHQHGRPNDLFVAIERPLKGGDDVTYEGNFPEGVTGLWVRFPYKNWMGEVQTVGNLRLSEADDLGAPTEQEPINWEKIFNEFG